MPVNDPFAQVTSPGVKYANAYGLFWKIVVRLLHSEPAHADSA
jgi:hypothetical protein